MCFNYFRVQVVCELAILLLLILNQVHACGFQNFDPPGAKRLPFRQWTCVRGNGWHPPPRSLEYRFRSRPFVTVRVRPCNYVVHPGGSSPIVYDDISCLPVYVCVCVCACVCAIRRTITVQPGRIPATLLITYA